MKSIKSLYLTITTILFARILYYVNKSINNSSDFQWSATHLIISGINPYESWLANINTSEDYLEKIVNIQPARFSKYCRGILNFHNI